MKTTLATLSMILLGIGTVGAALVSVQPGDWSDPDTWGGNVPAANDEVTVAHDLTLNSSTPALQSLSMTAGSLTVSGWNSAIVAHTVDLQGGTLTHSLQTDTVADDGWTPDSRVWIQATDVTVGSGSTINVFGKGYQGAPSGAGTHVDGYGPGYGYSGRGGGAYGGNGGGAFGRGSAYGSLFLAEQPGSGGGRSDNGIGGNGGGNLRIEATGAVTLNGNIDASGQNNVYRGGGGASGGGVYIEADTLTGSANILVNGGTHSWGGDYGRGSGGRIVLRAGTSSYGGTVTANAGAGATVAAQSGTLYTLLGEPTPGALSQTAGGTPQLDTSLSVVQHLDGIHFLRAIDEWSTYSLAWTDDSQTLLDASLTNEATYTLTGLAPNYGHYQVFVDGVNIFGGHIASDAFGALAPFAVTLGSEHSILVTIPEPASVALLAIGLLALARRGRAA